MNDKLIAAFVREKRLNRGWSQTDLSKEAKLSLRSISALERNESVKKETIEKALKALEYKLVVSYGFRKLRKG